MEPELTFSKIIERVELPELLTHFGYALKTGEHLSNGKWHVFEGDDTLVVYRGQGNEWRYFNSQDDRDKGNVIDWMKNRVNSGRIAGIGQLPGRDLWQSVNDHFRTYLNLPEEQRTQLELPPIGKTAPGAKFHSVYAQHCRPLENTAYLEGRGITKSTIENPQFVGRIFNQLRTVQREGLPPKTFVNTAFPVYHEGRVVGLELKGEGLKGQTPESPFSCALWLSKLPEGEPATALVVSESALDALSYAQLHSHQKALYASTAGPLTQNKVFELRRLLDEENIPGIRAAFNNDTQGHHFDTRLLAGLAGEQNLMRVAREHEHLITVEIITHPVAAVQALSQLLRAYNEQTTRQFVRQAGPAGLAADSQTLRDELIHSAKQGAHSYQFHIPFNREALAAFNQAALQTLKFECRVEIVKSESQNWNQDLQQDQRQRVVQRELSGLNSDQPGSSQEQRNPAPNVGAAKLPSWPPEAQDNVRASGERLLVVEFRESRDAVAQLPQLRESLERAGVTIDHSVKLETSVAREITTALILRYRPNSILLPAISEALDALHHHPKATVIELAQDAVERRQLAAALKQPLPAGPPLILSNSPAHDQARQVFIQAAAQLVSDLRAGGANLEAARLQEVSRQLVSRAELAGLNRENVEKVLALVDKVPALQNAPAVQQLRQAVQLLQTPVLRPPTEYKLAHSAPATRRAGPRS